MHTGLWAGCWPELDLSQSQEVKSQPEEVGHEMTRPESRHGPLRALCSPGPWP